MADAVLEEIATRAGVSVRTVYRILNGGVIRDSRPNISKRAQKIREIAKELHYRPNYAAKAVSTGRFNCISLLISEFPRYGRLHHDLLRGILHVLARRNMHMAMSVISDACLTSNRMMPSLLNQLMADGMLINYTHGFPAQMLELIRLHDIPSIWINADLPHDCVVPDDFGGGHLAVKYLTGLGCRRIDFVHYVVAPHINGPQDVHFSLPERLRGYRTAMQEAGLPAQNIELSGEKIADSLPVLRGWLERPGRPEAIITAEPRVALALLSAAKGMGMRLPEDLHIITFQGNPAYDELDDELRTMVIPWFRVGYTAAEMVTRKIDAPGERLERVAVPYNPPVSARERKMLLSAQINDHQERSIISDITDWDNLF